MHLYVACMMATLPLCPNMSHMNSIQKCSANMTLATRSRATMSLKLTILFLVVAIAGTHLYLQVLGSHVRFRYHLGTAVGEFQEI